MYNFDEVRRVCQTSTIAGITAMYEASPTKPFRFLYMSGDGVNRDLDAPVRAIIKLWGMQDYLRMRV
jgi:hypothetical protein